MKKRIYIVLSFMLARLLTACGARTTAEQTSTPPAAAGEAVVDAADADPGQEEEAEDLPEDGSYTSKEEVALYLHLYDHLPSNFITKQEARKLGWEGGSLEPYAPGKCIGGGDPS